MKRWIAFLTGAMLLLSLCGCKPIKTKYTDYSFDYFDTVTTVVGYAESKAEFDAVCTEIKALLKEYVAVVREITKKFEQTVRGTLTEVIAHFKAHPPKGEFVIVLAGKDYKDRSADSEESAALEEDE